jgi:hypothetical protein
MEKNKMNNLASPIYTLKQSFVERNYSLENRIAYANNFIKHLRLKSLGDFIIIQKHNYIYKDLHIKTQIGTESKHGAVYQVLYNVKPNQYIVAVKLLCVNTTNNKEISIFKKVSKVVLAKKTIHFPIIYFTHKIIKTDSMPNSMLPSVLRKCNSFHSVFNELFAGDLKMIMSKKKQQLPFIKNAITQIFFSISNFSHYTKYIHNDAHWGNFLYHKIKPGGFFYYKVNNLDVYVENIGYIWVIWDYSYAKKITSSNVTTDYSRIIHAFYPYLLDGWIPQKIHKDVYDDKGIDFALQLRKNIKMLEYYDETVESMKTAIHKVLLDLYPELLIKPDDSLIINTIPYIIQ